MRYTLLIRALVNIKQKEKAEEHLARLFPGTAPKIDGRYWKDQSLWEANLRRETDYPNDHAALWETLSYVRGAAAKWLIVSGPNDARRAGNSDRRIIQLSSSAASACSRLCVE